ncbi:hypothetical protein SHKM778_33520 [Streptomyces sp. KM77-8]|uniref:SCP domain-containing protein n=1 Tax=Streptomyces haneummycinicus TaxID=3074435 RepID=A0AAT9HHW9_9ACTN
MVDLVNAERGKVGCSPVKVNSTLTKAAQDHSEDMAATGTMSHTGSDGSSPPTASPAPATAGAPTARTSPTATPPRRR